mmetsp:Transcript_79337/g.157167  ORF Transcript_79337/g.157167 Transcript_79337/m.157167 type:complete len:334 (-) Transcript_79337:53-1054(-)
MFFGANTSVLAASVLLAVTASGIDTVAVVKGVAGHTSEIHVSGNPLRMDADTCRADEDCMLGGEHPSGLLPEDTVLLQMSMSIKLVQLRTHAPTDMRQMLAIMLVLSCIVFGAVAAFFYYKIQDADAAPSMQEVFRRRFLTPRPLERTSTGQYPKTLCPPATASSLSYEPRHVLEAPHVPATIPHVFSLPASRPMSMPITMFPTPEVIEDEDSLPVESGGGCRMLTVSVCEPLEGRKLGIKLSEDDLELVKFTDARAMKFGFSVGDRVAQVNERPVSNQQDFMEALHDAFGRLERFGETMKFKVLRPHVAPALQPPVVPALPLLHRHTVSGFQ